MVGMQFALAFTTDVFYGICINLKQQSTDDASNAHLAYAQVYIVRTSEKYQYLATFHGPALVSAYLVARFLVNVRQLKDEFVSRIANIRYTNELKVLIDRQEFCDQTLRRVSDEFKQFNQRIMCHAASIFLVHAFTSTNYKTTQYKGCFEYRVKPSNWPTSIVDALELAQNVRMV